MTNTHITGTLEMRKHNFLVPCFCSISGQNACPNCLFPLGTTARSVYKKLGKKIKGPSVRSRTH